jgi:hypothetical protein
VTPAQLQARNAAISAGQKRAWADPFIRSARVAAIRNAWDPLKCALMSKTITELRAMPGGPYARND